MPELRQNRFTKEWVIIATERAKRPEEMAILHEVKPLPSYVAACPFCPGNERLAPPEVCHMDGPDGAWQLRVIPNKFAALAREGEPRRVISRSHRTMNGVGIHDVIVEARDHNANTAFLSDEHVANILRCYRERYLQVSQDLRVTHVTIFKNHGLAAGTSLEHPHSQLIATPVISHQVRNRIYEALRHYDEFGECIFCEVLNEELEEETRVVVATEHFVALEQFASPTPFATHIYPRRHMASFGAINDLEVTDLGRVLRTVLAKLYVGLQNPDYNYTIRSAPAENVGVKYYHWYLSIIPRLTRVAGFELGSGMFINTVLPEAAAEFLRNLPIVHR
ncbi:MAG TPA: galactose-1-phosphate uridylyltransferase [Clostridia bacterium]|nr:galactose-1-phosphate uridylyltransferase [Clostridia bacterium]